MNEHKEFDDGGTEASPVPVEQAELEKRLAAYTRSEDLQRDMTNKERRADAVRSCLIQLL